MKLVLFCSKRALRKRVYVKARGDAVVTSRAWAEV